MKLEDQVTNLQLSKKLKELGFKQDSLFYHWIDSNGGKYREIMTVKPHNPQGGWDYFSAYTVAELGEMLPKYLKIEDKYHWLTCSVASTDGMGLYPRWCIQYEGLGFDYFRVDKSEANARAKMLIYLKENKLI